MRYELQQKELNIRNVFDNSMYDNELQFAVCMIVVDALLYFVLALTIKKFFKTELEFHKVPAKKMAGATGATVENVSIIYDRCNTPAIHDVSIRFQRDCVTSLLGRNGAGKSSIIRLLTGQVAPTSGKVYWSQTNIAQQCDKIGLCPQHSVVIPNLTTLEHLQLYASIKLSANRQTEVNKIMASLSLGKYKNYCVENLSGGYKRLLNVAIAFLGSPNLVILDEPCSGIDIEARKIIWQLIAALRKDRAVILATHYLDEAENLSDNILIFRNGKVVAENSSATLQDQFTRSFDLKIQMAVMHQIETVREVKMILEPYSPNSVTVNGYSMTVNVPYHDNLNSYRNFEPLIKSLELLVKNSKIEQFKIVGKTLEDIFNQLNCRNVDRPKTVTNGQSCRVDSPETKKPANGAIMRALFWKRFIHFKRNYKLMVCILILPVLFEIAAMGLMTLRGPNEFDVNLKFATDLYSNSTEFYRLVLFGYCPRTVFYTYFRCSIENGNEFGRSVVDNLECDVNCEQFNKSESAFRWILETHNEYINRRYGGITANDSVFAIWYNNKGYHAMPVWLNRLSTALLRAELNDSSYNIETSNYPLKLGRKELSMSSM